MVRNTSLYSSRSIKIPAPHFIVFYNGIKKQPERTILKLSDLYQVQEEEPMLELQVLMLNINDGNNEELKESCQVLKEYMQYVNRVRENIYQSKMSLNDAVEHAVTECIDEGILEDFLRENRAEVVPMSIFEFDEEREWRMIREAEYRYGVEDGRASGLTEGRVEGRAEEQLVSAKEFVQGIDNLIINLKLSLEEACAAIGSTVQKYEEAKKMLNI